MAGLSVGPLSAYRIQFLADLGNIHAGGEGGATGARALAEALLVCHLTRDQLVALRGLALDFWEEELETFYAGLTDEQLAEFSGWLQREYGAQG